MSTPARRGRPPKRSIQQRILEGMASNSQLKCDLCYRVFPRPKSLRAHMNCHTGTTPYVCDYPKCVAKFKQSGHLRSHFLRHSGETPFKCPRDDCNKRYVHGNRHCSVHDPEKKVKLIRDGKETVIIKDTYEEEEKQWIIRYQIKKNNKKGKKKPAGNSHKENIPVNRKRKAPYKNDGYNSAGLESPSSSPIHRSEHNPPGLGSPQSSPIYKSEQNPAGLGSPSTSSYSNESFAMSESSSSSIHDLDDYGLEGAHILVRIQTKQFKQGSQMS